MTDIENETNPRENTSDSNSDSDSVSEKSSVAEDEKIDPTNQTEVANELTDTNTNYSSKYRQTGRRKRPRKHPYHKNTHDRDPYFKKDDLINTIQNLSYVDSNSLTQSIAPIISSMKFEKPQFKPRPKSNPSPSQHDQDFKLDEKFVSALMPKDANTIPSKDFMSEVDEVNLRSFVNNNNDDAQLNNGGNIIGNFDNHNLSDLHLKIETLLDNESFLIILQYLEKLQKETEENIDKRRQENTTQHNLKRSNLYNLHRKRLEKQPGRRNEVIARNNKECKDLESLILKETADFENQVSKEIDNATRDQQIILQNAGVPGFFPTTNKDQIALQSKILNLLTTAVKERMVQKSNMVYVNPNVQVIPYQPYLPPPPPTYHYQEYPFIPNFPQ